MMVFKRKKKSLISSLIIIVLIIGTVVTGCKKDEVKEPIKIGFIGVLTGMYATTGIRGRDGATLAVEQINEKGGINGRQIELIIKDDENNPEKAVAAFKELEAAGVVAIIGHTSSTTTLEILPHLNRTDILMLGDAGSSLFSGQDDQYFRVVTATDQVGKVLANLAIEHIKIKKLGAIYDIANAGYTEVLYNHFKDGIVANGGEVVSVVTFDSREEVSMPTLMEQLGDVEGVFIVGSALHMALISQHLRNKDSSIEVLVPYLTLEYLQTGGPQVDGVYSFAPYDKYLTNDKVDKLKSDYQERFSQELSRTSQELYEVMDILFDVLERAGDSKGLKETLLEKRTYEGLTTKLIFDDYGEMHRTQYIITVKDGTDVIIGTIEPDIHGN